MKYKKIFLIEKIGRNSSAVPRKGLIIVEGDKVRDTFYIRFHELSH